MSLFFILNLIIRVKSQKVAVVYLNGEVVNAVIRGCVALTALILAILCERHKRYNSIYVYLQAFLLCMGLWDTFYAGYLLTYDPNIAAFFNSLMYAANSFAAVFFFLLCFKYAYPEKNTIRFSLLLFVVPSLTALFSATYWFQDFMISYIYIFVRDPARIVPEYPGPWFYVHLVYSYSVCIIGFLLFVQKIRKKSVDDRAHFLFLFVVCVVLIGINIIVTTTMYYTVFSIVLSGLSHLICVLAVYTGIRFDKIEQMISMCSDYIEDMFPIPLFIVDTSGSIVFKNAGGQHILRAHGVSDYTLLSSDALYELFTKRTLPVYVLKQNEDESVSDVFLLQDNLGGIIYYVESKVLVSRKNKPLGSLLLFTNITKVNRLLVSLEEFAFRDVLTGAYTRYYYEIRRSLFESSPVFPFSLMMCDIDNLKKVNDNYGHQAGDEYIVSCCSALFQNLRKSDLIFRLGGDEFLVFLLHTTQLQAEKLIEKIEQNVVLPKGDFDFERGMSIGCATQDTADNFSFDVLQQNADAAMYKAKVHRKSLWRGYE